MRATTAVRTALGSVGHGDQLTVVDHLDELRTRMIVSLVVIGVAFALCFWQNGRLLSLIDAPLAHQTQQQVKRGDGPLGDTYAVQVGARDVAVQVRNLAGVLGQSDHSPEARAKLANIESALSHDVTRLSRAPDGNKPVTLGIGEPFMTTVGVAFIFALILSLPVLLLQAYGFFMPALEPAQRRALRPVLTAVPGLFVVGVAFGYTVVLPAAIHFLENFNSGQFETLVQASQYYHFAATLLLAMGLIFEVPVLIVALTQGGITTPRQLRRNRRYAIAACAAVGAFLPGDALTMLLETVPLYLLFELGILVAAGLDYRGRRRALRAATAQ